MIGHSFQEVEASLDPRWRGRGKLVQLIAQHVEELTMTLVGAILRKRLLAISTVAALIFFGGCGSDRSVGIAASGTISSTEVEPITDRPADPSSGVPITAPPTTAIPTTIHIVEETTESTVLDGSVLYEGAAGSDFCLAYYQVENLIGAGIMGEGTDTATAWDDVILAIAEMSEHLPPEFEDQLSLSPELWSDLRTVMARHDYEVAAAAEDMDSVFARYTFDDTSEAEFDAYLVEVCTR